MLMDKRTEFADAESVAAVASTILVGDVLNLGIASRDIGVSNIYLQLLCQTDIITAGAAGTIQFKLVSDAQAAIATDGSASEHFATKAFVTDDGALNELDAGDVIAQLQLPLEGGVPYEQYLGILAIIATTTITAGAIDAFMTLDPTAWKAYADAAN